MVDQVINFIQNSFTEEVAGYIEDAFSKAIGDGQYFGMFLIAVAYIILALKKEDYAREKLIFGVYSIIVLIMNFNPVFANLSVKILGNTVYWRVFWLLPIGFVLAFAFTDFLFKLPGKVKKILGFALIVGIIAFSGTYVYDDENYSVINNYYKVPDTMLEMILAISEDNEETKIAVGPPDFEVYARQVDGNIQLIEGRAWGNGYSENNIITYLNFGNYELAVPIAEARNCNYIIILNTAKHDLDDLTNYGYVEMLENGEYTLYKKPSTTETETVEE